MINGKQGTADQRRSQWGEGKTVIDCTACVFLVERVTRGGTAKGEGWRAGFALRAAVTALCP